MTKGVAGFANLSAYKEKYRSLLRANRWGAGWRVMPKNSWSSWQEAVKSLLEILGKQRVHQMTGGSNVGGVGGTDGADRQEEGDAEEEEALCFFSRCICKKKNLHWPGIEPGSTAWQAAILPLNHQCTYYYKRLISLLMNGN